MIKSLFLSLLGATTLYAEPAQLLTYDPPVGQYKMSQVMEVEMEMKNPLTRGAMTAKTDMQFGFTLDVAAVTEGRQFTAEVAHLALKASVAGMPPMEYDSADTDSDSPMAPMFAGVVGMTAGVIVDADGKVVKEITPTEAAHPMVQQMGGGSTQFIEMISQSLQMFPERPLAVGDSWEVESALSLGAMGNDAPMTVTSVYTLEGYEELAGHPTARISYTATMKGEVDMGGMAMQVQSQSCTGTSWHDTTLNLTRKSITNADLIVSVPEGTALGPAAMGDLPYKMQVTVTLD